MVDLKKSVLLLTDFSYPAKGREYYREDVELSGYLRKSFNVYISHIQDCEKLLDLVDVVLIRNTGPQVTHQECLRSLKSIGDLRLFNDLSGKGDLQGKKHLLELYEAGYPVIPSFRTTREVLNASHYLLKPLNGADSCGVKLVDCKKLREENVDQMIIQPLIDFEYEVSFYFIGENFHYALYAPDPGQRWMLKPYPANDREVAFALQFIRWNSCKWGIQRVDACKLPNGELLLMELEDYNPYLSLDVLSETTRTSFLEALCDALLRSG